MLVTPYYEITVPEQNPIIITFNFFAFSFGFSSKVGSGIYWDLIGSRVNPDPNLYTTHMKIVASLKEE